MGGGLEDQAFATQEFDMRTTKMVTATTCLTQEVPEARNVYRVKNTIVSTGGREEICEEGGRRASVCFFPPDT